MQQYSYKKLLFAYVGRTQMFRVLGAYSRSKSSSKLHQRINHRWTELSRVTRWPSNDCLVSSPASDANVHDSHQRLH